uniref:Uncharacterized protein n=1 Tax=Plectus sambesii TaxID=2011161 RepID=A0A914VND6_9BILA
MSEAPKPRSQCDRQVFVVASLPSNPVFMATLEVQGLSTSDRLIKLQHALYNIKADIIALMCLRWPCRTGSLSSSCKNNRFANGSGAQMTVGQRSRSTTSLAHWISPSSVMPASSTASITEQLRTQSGRPKHEECQKRIGWKHWASHR